MLWKILIKSLWENWPALLGLAAMVLPLAACPPEGATSTPIPAVTAQATYVAPTAVPSQGEILEINMRISSDVEGGKCLSSGDKFYLSLQMEGIPEDWEGPRSANVIFQVGLLEDGQIWVLNETQAIKFQLDTGETAQGSIRVVFSLPDGSAVRFENPEFPYFRYTGQNQEGKFCFDLPFGTSPGAPLRKA